MATAGKSIKTLAVFFVCLYAISYPLAAHFLMNEEGTGGVGSIPVQAFQAATLGAFALVGRFGRGSLRNIVDVWTSSAIYILGASCCFAAFCDGSDRWVELSYGARILFWLFVATCFARGSFDVRELRHIALSFWIGAVLQSLIAVHAFATQHVSSIYREVYATTGGAYVSGKMIAAFVFLGMLASLYWFRFEKRFRAVYFSVICIGVLVLLFSYNRAAQLSATVAMCWALGWLFQTRRIKSALLFVFLLIALGMILGAFGETFLVRWQNIRADGGSGRDKLLVAAVNRLMAPESLSTLFFGCGYCQTKNLMYEACGAHIGTHSDLFDALTVYGLVGGVFYLLIVQRLLGLKSGIERREPEYFFIRLATIFIVLIGLLTGMFQGTYAFFFILALCHYWRAVYFDRLRRPVVDAPGMAPFPPPPPLPQRPLGEPFPFVPEGAQDAQPPFDPDRRAPDPAAHAFPPPAFENAPRAFDERPPRRRSLSQRKKRSQATNAGERDEREKKDDAAATKRANVSATSDSESQEIRPDAAAYLWNLNAFSDLTVDEEK